MQPQQRPLFGNLTSSIPASTPQQTSLFQTSAPSPQASNSNLAPSNQNALFGGLNTKPDLFSGITTTLPPSDPKPASGLGSLFGRPATTGGDTSSTTPKLGNTSGLFGLGGFNTTATTGKLNFTTTTDGGTTKLNISAPSADPSKLAFSAQPLGNSLFSGASGKVGGTDAAKPGNSALSNDKPSLFGAGTSSLGTQGEKPSLFAAVDATRSDGGPTSEKPSLFSASSLGSQADKPSMFGGTQGAGPTGDKPSLFGASALGSLGEKSSLFGAPATPTSSDKNPILSVSRSVTPNNVGVNGASTTTWYPFGLSATGGVEGVRSEALPREVVKQQMLACGIDIDSLPMPLQMVLPRILNPNTRTLQFLIKLMSRVVTLEEIRRRGEDLSCFVFSRAPNSDIAIKWQALCEQQAAAAGPVFLQKLNKAKGHALEPRSQFFPELLRGFEGLQTRVKDQAAFFQNFAATLKGLQQVQRKSHDTFQERAIERLHRIRKRQAELRHRTINLVGNLDAMAVRAQGFEGDDQEIAQIEEEYEKLKRFLVAAPDSLQREAPLIRQRMVQIRETLTLQKSSAVSDAVLPWSREERASSLVGGSPFTAAFSMRKQDITPLNGDQKSLQDELLTTAMRHHQELEALKKRMSVLGADIHDLVESIGSI